MEKSGQAVDCLGKFVDRIREIPRVLGSTEA